MTTEKKSEVITCIHLHLVTSLQSYYICYDFCINLFLSRKIELAVIYLSVSLSDSLSLLSLTPSLSASPCLYLCLSIYLLLFFLTFSFSLSILSIPPPLSSASHPSLLHTDTDTHSLPLLYLSLLTSVLRPSEKDWSSS